MLIKKVSITFISLLFVNIMFAGDVSGRVSDVSSGDFLPGANQEKRQKLRSVL